LKDGDARVRILAVEILGNTASIEPKNFYADAAIGDLKALLLSEKEPSDVKRETLITLGKIGLNARSVLPEIEVFLKADDGSVRQAAVSAVDQITRRISENRERVTSRFHAQVLHAINPDNGQTMSRELEAAFLTLTKLDAEAIPTLEAVLQDPRMDYPRLFAVQALGSMGLKARQTLPMMHQLYAEEINKKEEAPKSDAKSEIEDQGQRRKGDTRRLEREKEKEKEKKKIIEAKRKIREKLLELVAQATTNIGAAIVQDAHPQTVETIRVMLKAKEAKDSKKAPEASVAVYLKIGALFSAEIKSAVSAFSPI
jgi:hypothetical protein